MVVFSVFFMILSTSSITGRNSEVSNCDCKFV